MDYRILLRSFATEGLFLERSKTQRAGLSYLWFDEAPGGLPVRTGAAWREGGGESRFRRIRRHRALNLQETMIIVWLNCTFGFSNFRKRYVR